MAKKLRVAILISGRGSNMAALIRAASQRNYPAEIDLVVSNRPDAPGLEFARDAGIPTAVVDHQPYGSNRKAFEAAVDSILKANKIEFICLAGFMRLLTSWFVSRWNGKILNIHPALLPAFPGLHTHERAIEKGVKIHGASVHFVNSKMDSGPMLARVPINVRENDTVQTLTNRVLRIEHRIYTAALKLVAEGRVKVKDGHCFVDGHRINDRVLFFINGNRRMFKGRKAFAFTNMSRNQAAA